MKTALAIFVKTPHRSPVKTRLAASIGTEKATEFFTLCIKAIEATAKNVTAIPHWAIAEHEALNDKIWKSFPALHTGNGCLGTRQHHIYETLLKTHDAVILIGADTPQLNAATINDAITDLKTHKLKTHTYVIGPANDGGYYLFGGTSSIPKSVWTNTPWSANNTRERFIKNLGENPHQLPPLTDIDTVKDLTALAAEMPINMTPEQKETLNPHYTHHHQEHKISSNADD